MFTPVHVIYISVCREQISKDLGGFQDYIMITYSFGCKKLATGDVNLMCSLTEKQLMV